MSKLFDLATNPEQYTHGEATSWMADDVRQQAQHELYWDAIKPFIPPHCLSVLDIGCGSGWAAKKFFNAGVKHYTGLEPSLKNFEVARREHANLNIQRLTLAEYAPTQSFDCVLALMVMSHIQDVDAAFQKMYHMLHPGGVCLLVVSRFHPPEHRNERNGRKYEVEEIDAEQYSDRSIEGTSFGIADIKRLPAYYMRLAAKNGFTTHETEFADAGYSPKLLFVLRRGL